jgi:CO/xanthine dehydrogenase FAD-binding subunit
VAQRSGDFALAAAAATVSTSGEVRLALMGVADTPLRIEAAEKALAGSFMDDEAIETAWAAVDAAIDPMSDLHASADYRRHLAKVLTRRVLKRAWQTVAR